MTLAPGGLLTEAESAELMLSDLVLLGSECTQESLGDLVKMQSPGGRSGVGSEVLGF